MTDLQQESPIELQWGQTWPQLPEFKNRAVHSRVIPVVRKLLFDEYTATGIFRKVADSKVGSFILESAHFDGSQNRWSFIGVTSQAILTSQQGQAHWSGTVPVGIKTTGPIMDVIANALEVLATKPVLGLPPLTGALVGTLGWNIFSQWEPVGQNKVDSISKLPQAALCLATDVIAVDHQNGSVWLIANAINTDGTDKRVEQAWQNSIARLDAMENKLLSPQSPKALILGPNRELEVKRNTSKENFEAKVLAAKEAIRDGEVFQVVLSQRLDARVQAETFDIYRMLKTINPSPYMYCLFLADSEGKSFDVVGASPETLVRVDKRQVSTFPIAGSRPRGKNRVEDDVLAAELLSDPKELCEHIMLVDLARNDLSRVCKPQSVQVSALAQINKFSHIMHITSTVCGQLAEGKTALDAVVATFPAGTLSGAPKPRAISLIGDLEEVPREIYGGVVGYFDFAGNADLAIAIRTACISDGWAQIQAGAGIVADSVPQTEYEETENKAAAALRAVQLAHRAQTISS